jgi:hypothetical protein
MGRNTLKNKFILDLTEGNDMKRFIIMILLPTLVLCMVECSRSQDYPFLRKVDVQASVSFDSTNAMFSYAYKITNGSENRGRIQTFEIDISRSDNSQQLDSAGLRFAGSGLLERWFRRDYPPRQHRIVPVGFPVLPGREWLAMLLSKPWVSFSADTFFIAPGNSVESIVIMSKGLPGIRAFVVKPNFQDDVLFPSIEDTSETAMTTAQMDSIREAVNYHGSTIGPIAPLLNFMATAWCDTIASYKHKAVELGWIENQGIVNSLDQKLENAKAQLEKGNTTSARNILQAFVNEVEALNKEGGKITSEAYALLKFNAEYLMGKL